MGTPTRSKLPATHSPSRRATPASRAAPPGCATPRSRWTRRWKSASRIEPAAEGRKNEETADWTVGCAELDGGDGRRSAGPAEGFSRDHQLPSGGQADLHGRPAFAGRPRPAQG